MSRWSLILIVVVAAAACLHQALLHAMPASHLRNSFGQSDEQRRRTEQQRTIVGLFERAGEGNALLWFDGFDPTSVDDDAFVSMGVYYPATHALWPRRAFVADAGTIVNGGDALLAERFQPPVPWLAANDVRAIVEFTPGGATVRPLPPLPPSPPPSSSSSSQGDAR